MSDLTYPWKRLWCPRAGTINLSDGGYLYVPQATWTGAAVSDVVPVESISSTQCLILLGEPGMGKTVAMKEERQSIDSQVAQMGGKTRWLDLREFGSEERLIRELFESEIFAEWKQSNYQLHVFLDGLDEALLRIDTISEILGTKLPHYPVERVYLRIACRTADWPNDLEQGLYSIWGKDAVQAYELAPLRRRDVAEAAQANEIDSETFLSEIDRVGAVPLAIRPVTLEFLINTYRRHGSLPSTQTELYLKGCRRLCEVQSPTEPHAVRSRYVLTADQRLAVAARIAAVTIFAGRFAIWADIDRGDVPEEDVAIRELSGGKEQAGNAKFDVTEGGIWETLGTGLFSSRGPNRLGWSHQTYAEFLAAWYLVQNNLPLAQMMSLIVHPYDSDGKIVPQLQEAAAWLASMIPTVFREIIKSDPQVLLRSDVTKADVKDREALVQSLLELFDQEQLLDWDWDIRRLYSKLAHPRLAEQLRPYIIDSAKGIMVRRVATDIAEECRLQALQTELVTVALDRTNPQTVRVNAAYAASRVADDTTKAQLKPLALNRGDDDEDDQLKGVALSTLWPTQMTTAELFSALTPPKRKNLVGAYQAFVSPGFVQHIQPNDLPIALNWVENLTSGGGFPSPFADVIDAVMLLAWAHLEIPGVLQAFARAALKRFEHMDGIVGERGRNDPHTQQFAQELASQDEKRHLVLEALLALTPDLERNWPWLFFQVSLVMDKDLPWLITRLKDASGERDQQKWAFLIEKATDWYEPAQVDTLIDEAKDYPALVRALGKIKASYPERERVRRESQHKRRVEPIKPSPEERVATLLSKCEGEDSGAWWLLNRAMMLEPTSAYYGSELYSDLTSLPGWKSADENTRARILTAARRYLLEQGPNTPEWLGRENVVYYPALAGYRALELLLRESADSAPALSPDVWKRWAPVIPTFPNKGSSSDEYHYELLRMAYERAPDEIIQTILVIIDEENRATGNIFITFQLRPFWDERLSNAIVQKLSDTTLKPDSIGSLLRELLDHHDGRAKRFAESLVLLSSSGQAEGRSKAVVAAQALLSHADDAGWSTVWPIIEKDTEFGRAVVAPVASRDDFHGANVAKRLSEEQLADLYLWVERNYPHSEDPQEEGWHSVTDRESVARWRDGILQHLKNRGTTEAVSAMRRVAHELPELRWLRWDLLETRDLTRRGTWVPPHPESIIRIAANQDLRLVQNGEQLLEVVAESLRRLEAKLHAEIPAAQFLWNGARPKDESAFSDYVAMHFRDDLKQRGIISNREVQIHQIERTDIHVDAVSEDSNDQGYEHVGVIIESKGCWNPELNEAMKSQLVGRYLKDNDCQHGIYLVGWFNCDRWDDRDRRKQVAKRLCPSKLEVQSCLEKQATDLSQGGYRISAFVLDVSMGPLRTALRNPLRKASKITAKPKHKMSGKRRNRPRDS